MVKRWRSQLLKRLFRYGSARALHRRSSKDIKQKCGKLYLVQTVDSLLQPVATIPLSCGRLTVSQRCARVSRSRRLVNSEGADCSELLQDTVQQYGGLLLALTVKW